MMPDGGLSLGTGFVVDDGLIITNNHVVAESAYVQIMQHPPASERFLSSATISVVDQVRDLALLRVEGPLGDPLPMRREQAVAGEKVFSLGFDGLANLSRMKPGDPNLARLSRNMGSVSRVVNRVRSEEQRPVSLIQHSASIKSGQSGGPVVDLCDNVLGVNTGFAQYRDGSQAVFAIDVGEVMIWLDENSIDYKMSDRRCRTKRT